MEYDAGLLTGKTSYDATGLETMKTLYDYDGKGRQISMKDYRMDGSQERLFRVTSTGYDAYGRTAWVSETDSTQKTVRVLEYDPLGRLSVIEDYPGLAGTSGTCIRKAYQYDIFDRITGIEYRKGNTLLEEYHYTYDKKGRITGKTEENLTPSVQADHTDRSVTYTYDAYGRLTGSTETDHTNGNAVTSVTYSYDKAGNRTGKTEGNKTTTYFYNGLDQLTEAVTVSGVTELSHLTCSYDDNGNQTEEADSISGRTVSNSYDEENRLSGTVISEPQQGGDPVILTQTNSYNGDGQRVKKDEDGNVTRYFYEDGGVSYTMGTGSTQKDLQYIRDLSGNVFLVQESGGISDPATLHYDEDIQGSTTSLLDMNGDGVASYSYDDFGETGMHGDLTLKNEVCYTGGVYDRLTGEYYLNARYYSPETGRFLTEDTYRGEIGKPETYHLYIYCANDSVNNIDPSGHLSKRVSIDHIKKNMSYIRNAAKIYKVNKFIVAACIYTELVLNVNVLDTLDGFLGFYNLADTSIGLGQVKVSTAKMLEKKGYIGKTKKRHVKINGKYYNLTIHQSRIHRLLNNKCNIRYVAAYLRYWINVWKNKYPRIERDPRILGTLYNLGDRAKKPNKHPKPNPFGKAVGCNYYF